MTRYANGQVPYTALVKFGSGPDSITGTWEWWLSPGSLAKWRALVAYCQKNYGWTPRISTGWNAYRPLAAQQKYRAYYTSIGKPLQAALPGYSSHGGSYKDRDSLAVDVGNYAEVGFAKFAAACKATGWATNVVVPQELWHIVDFDPWAAVPADTGNSQPLPHPTPGTSPAPVPEEDDMGYYFRTGPQDSIYFWNESRGRARILSRAEQEWRKACADTKGGVGQTIVTVSPQWQAKALALGTYAAG